ncbi:MAG: hypothetical protein ACOC0Z_07595 [Halohasta sp.]
MSLTAKQVQWSAIVVGAIVYFFTGTFTDIAQSIQLLGYVVVAFVLPTVLLRAGVFDSWLSAKNPDTEYDY